MADELNTAPETGAPSDASVQIRDTPNEQGMIPATEVAGLKSALERLKEELKTIKPKAALVDQLATEGIRPEEVPTKLAALKEQQNAEERLSQILAEKEAQAKAEQAALSQRYEARVSALNSILKQQTRAQQLSDLYLAGGGSSSNQVDARDFQNLAQQYIEFEDVPLKDANDVIIGYQSTIKSFKAPNGKEPLWVDHEKEMGKVRPAELSDFITEIKRGKYGTALQNLLPAYNQASGSGIAATGGTTMSGKLVLKRSQLSNMGSLSPEQLKAVQSGNYELID